LELKPYHGEECVMITISQSKPGFFPVLYQIINNYDGTLTFQHLEHKDTHRIVKKVPLLTRENVESVLEKYVDVNTVNEIELSWGPYILFSYKID
jgi:hypothetical protein